MLAPLGNWSSCTLLSVHKPLAGIMIVATENGKKRRYANRHHRWATSNLLKYTAIVTALILVMPSLASPVTAEDKVSGKYVNSK